MVINEIDRLIRKDKHFLHIHISMVRFIIYLMSVESHMLAGSKPDKRTSFLNDF